MAEWATLKGDRDFGKVTSALRKFILFLSIGWVMARANVLDIHPFGLALMAVLAVNRDKKSLPGLLGVLSGSVFQQEWALSAQILASSLLCLWILPKIKDHPRQMIYFPVLTALAAFLPGAAWAVALQEIQPMSFLYLGVQGLLVAGFSMIFLYVSWHHEKLLRGNFTAEQGLAGILALGVFLSGLQGMSIGMIQLQVVVMGFSLLYIADRLGAGSAAGAGAILGFLLQWGFGVDNLVDAGIYGLLGMISGGFRSFGKLGMTLAYLAATLMMTYFMNDSIIEMHLYSSALGLGLFLLLPGRKKEKNMLKKKIMPEIETTVSKVKTVAEIFDQLAVSYQAAGTEAKLQPEVPEMINQLTERVCRTCPRVKECWEKEFYRSYHLMFDLFSYQEENMRAMAVEEILPPAWQKACNKLQEVMLAASFILEQQKDREGWQNRISLNRNALADQYKSVSQVISHLARELHSHHQEGGKPLVWSRQHRARLDIGIGTFIKYGNGVSGDNFASIPLSPEKSALIISDGMGAGVEAARISSAALTILEQLLSTGFEPEGAVKALNSILVLRSPEESFVTVDMVILDLIEDHLRLIKIGAAPTYFLDKGQVEHVKTSSLPVGILNDIEIPVIDLPWKDRTLVMVTDGVLDVVKGQGDWLGEFLERYELKGSAQDLAEEIIRQARQLAKDQMEDDGVVLVIRKKD